MEQVQLSEEVVTELRAAARSSLYFLAKGILGFRDMTESVHKPLCERLEDQARRRKRVVLPRGWFKSSIATIAYPIFCAIQETGENTGANERILIVQNTHDNARKKLQVIRTAFEKNAVLRALFPELLPGPRSAWTSDSLQLTRPGTFAEGTFECAGIRTQLTSRHYTRIIEDDTVAPDLDEVGMENLCPTKEDIEQAIGFHRYLVPPLLVHPAQSEVLVIGTRWFQLDLLSWIGQNQPDFSSYVRASKENTEGQADENGEITFPERFDQKTLDALRSDMGPYMYSCLYMNTPIRSEDMMFREEWFEYYETEDRDLIVTTTVDPANEEAVNKGETDWNVVVTTGKSIRTGAIFVLEATRGKWNPSQLINTIFDHQQRWNSLKVGIMAVQYEKTLQYWIKETMRKRGRYFCVELLSHGGKSKTQRVMGLQPPIADKKIRFRRTQHWLVNELLLFPYGKNDDGADALSMHLPLWAQTQDPEERQEPEERGVFTFSEAERELVHAWDQKNKKDIVTGALHADVDFMYN